MNEDDLLRLLDLNHQELLNEFPEVSQIKNYCNLINDYFKNTISDDLFKSTLKRYNISNDEILLVTTQIKELRKKFKHNDQSLG